MDFTGKVVVITGASSGIGEALVYAFADRGAKVVMGARNSAKLAEIAAQLFTRGIESAFEATDVTREEDCKRLIDKALSAFGRIDILICNAGISMRALFDDVQLDVLRQLMDVNFWGTVYCAKYALPALQAAKGTLVGVSSVAGMHGLPGRTGYSASKFAMTDGRLSGFHRIERTLLGADRRRNQSGRITPQRKQNDECRRGRPTDYPWHRTPQTHTTDGIRRPRHIADRQIRTRPARPLILQPYGQRARFSVQIINAVPSRAFWIGLWIWERYTRLSRRHFNRLNRRFTPDYRHPVNNS